MKDFLTTILESPRSSANRRHAKGYALERISRLARDGDENRALLERNHRRVNRVLADMCPFKQLQVSDLADKRGVVAFALSGYKRRPDRLDSKGRECKIYYSEKLVRQMNPLTATLEELLVYWLMMAKTLVSKTQFGRHRACLESFLPPSLSQIYADHTSLAVP